MGKDTQKTIGRTGRGRDRTGNDRGNLILREFSSGGVVFKRENNKVLWLVTKMAILPNPLHPPSTWRLPKGWLDDLAPGVPGPLASGGKRATENDLQQTAIREVSEEGGVEARIIKKIGTVKFFFNSTRGRVLKFVTSYLMEWIRDLPGGTDFETSEVAWLSYDEAYKRLTYDREKQILKKAKELLESSLV